MAHRRFALAMTPLAVASVVALSPNDAPADTPCPEGMVRIPGRDANGRGDAVAPYCLDVTEVTVDSYKRCVDGGACTEPNPPSTTHRYVTCNWGRPGRGLHPVNCVDWYQASSYCSSLGKRLPSGFESVWAARNGPEDTAYPWGDSAPSAALVNACGAECWPSVPTRLGWDWKGLQARGDGPLYLGDDGFPETAPVGSFPRGDNRWGVHDLAGNVTEWTSTYRDAAEGRLVDILGGAWLSGALGAQPIPFPGYDNRGLPFSRVSVARPSERGDTLGFRCAR